MLAAVRRMAGVGRCLLLLAAVCLAIPVPALAQTGDAKTMFAEGRRLRQAGDCKAAIVMFKRALAAWPAGLGALRNIAECQEELGLLASARRSYWDLRREVLKGGDPKYAGWDKDAERAHARLAGRVPRLTIRLSPAGMSAAVTVNGVTLAPSLVGVELERDAGSHEVVVRYGAGGSARRTVTLVEGSSEVVTIRLPEDAAKVPPAPKPTVKPVPKPEARPETKPEPGVGGRTVGGIVALSLGGLAAVGLGVAVGVRQGALDELEQACPTYETTTCPTTVSGAVDRGEAASTTANVLAVTAGVAVAAGVVLLATGGGEPRAGWLLSPTHTTLWLRF